MDEKKRIKCILQGDTSAFSYFVETYQDMAVTIAYRMCNNRQDAEDIAQDAFVKAFHNLHTFRLDSKFSTWLFRIVYNTTITHIHSSFYTSSFSDYSEINAIDEEADIIEKISEREKQEIVNRVLEQLPKDSSLILTLFYLNENSIKEIVQITGLSDANVKVKLHRARKQFASALSNIYKNEAVK
ncbi:MAG: RNA polymerase sigma factor [Dysgonomonas sp.]